MTEAVGAEVSSHDGEKDDAVVMTMSQVRRRSSASVHVTFQETEPPVSSSQEDKVEQESKKDEFSVRFHRDTMALVNLENNEEYELAHNFKEHSFGYPTYCEICSGLLVGLWSQGLQCKACGLNVHRGGGVGDHDDCRAEAMFTPCNGGSKSQEDKSLGEAIRELQQLAKNQPHFFADIRAQMDRDVMSHVKNTVVAAGVEEEKSKKFHRAKLKIVQFLDFIDAIEDRGKLSALFLLMRIKLLLGLVAAAIGFVLFSAAIVLRHHDHVSRRSFHLAFIHESTVLLTVHVGILLLVLLIRHLAKLFKRKVILIDHFLHEKFNINAKEDFGVSVAGAARRAVWWSDRAATSAAITCYAAMAFWWVSQPFFDTLETLDQPKGKVENAAGQGGKAGEL